MRNADSEPPSYRVLGIRIHALEIPQVISIIERWCRARGPARAISFTGMHGLTEAKKDASFGQVLNQLDLVVPDGMPVMMRGRLAGFPLQRRVAGPDLMQQFCAATGGAYKHFFLGGPPGLADRLASQLRNDYGIRCAGTYSPPFHELSEIERAELFRVVNDSDADLLWVGLSTPKQERWVHDFRTHLNVPVLLAVGAAFDFLAGTKQRAPEWMQEWGIEWLHRMLSEPRRLTKRYLVDGSRFIAYNAIELLKSKRTP